MSITKASNGWLVKVRIRKNGRIVGRQKLVTGGKEQAKALYEQMKKEIRSSQTGSLKSQSENELKTFADLLTLYKAKKGPFSESHTSKIDALSAEVGEISLDTFPEKFERYFQLLKIQINPKTEKTLANRSINRKTEIAKAAFNLLVDLELIEKNPIRIKKLKEVPRDVMISDEQQNELIKAIKSDYPHIEYIVRFALQVPCRRSELINMRMEDLDLFGNAIRIRNGTTKNGDGVWKPIPDDMIDYFRNIPKESEYLFYREVSGSRNDRSGVNKKYLPLGDFKKAWKGALEKAKLDGLDLHFHDTRHVAATDMIDEGTPEEVVMTVAGWKTNMLRVYYNRNPKKALSLVKFKKRNPIAEKQDNVKTCCENI
jgi:integrase